MYKTKSWDIANKRYVDQYSSYNTCAYRVQESGLSRCRRTGILIPIANIKRSVLSRHHNITHLITTIDSHIPRAMSLSWKRAQYCTVIVNMQSKSGVLRNTRYPFKTHLQLKSRSPVRPRHPIQLFNRFEILHEARQYHCRTICKITKWYDNRYISYGQRRFHKIGLRMSFGRISYIAQHPRLG